MSFHEISSISHNWSNFKLDVDFFELYTHGFQIDEQRHQLSNLWNEETSLILWI